VDGIVVSANGAGFGGLVVGQEGGHVGADMHFIQRADDRPALEEQDARDEAFGMLHLIDGAFFDGLMQALVFPVGAHLGMHHVLADRREFVGEQEVQPLDDLRVALHCHSYELRWP
jgi:hypothetical protein